MIPELAAGDWWLVDVASGKNCEARAPREWQKGLSAGFPREELFGLTAQLRRAAVSIPANLSEGACRYTTKAFIYHVSIALGSHAEVETCIEIACRLGYVSAVQQAVLLATCDTTGRLLNGLLRALESR